MSLLRQGEWEQAAKRGEEALSLPHVWGRQERCELLYFTALSLIRVGQRERARMWLSQGLASCQRLESDMVRHDDFARRIDEIDPKRTPTPTIRPDDPWKKAEAPEDLGLNSSVLEEHLSLCKESMADACLVAFDGTIVQEWYAPSYIEPIGTMSSVKSWVALLALLLAEQGKIGLDDEVATWIPEWKDGSARGVTVRHLLTMTSGLKNTKHTGKVSVGTVGDKTAHVLKSSLDAAPGEVWSYSNEGVQLLSPILERAAGVPLEEFARIHLFEPLGMKDTRLRTDAAGNPWVYGDAGTTLRDFAKICQLVLDDGKALDGTQIISSAGMKWLATPTDLNRGYGLLWFIEDGANALGTRGFRNTDCTAYKKEKLVVARMQSAGRQNAKTYYTDAYADLIDRIVGR